VANRLRRRRVIWTSTPSSASRSSSGCRSSSPTGRGPALDWPTAVRSLSQSRRPPPSRRGARPPAPAAAAAAVPAEPSRGGLPRHPRLRLGAVPGLLAPFPGDVDRTFQPPGRGTGSAPTRSGATSSARPSSAPACRSPSRCGPGDRWGRRTARALRGLPGGPREALLMPDRRVPLSAAGARAGRGRGLQARPDRRRHRHRVHLVAVVRPAGLREVLVKREAVRGAAAPSATGTW
jgi:hypothetical protein